MNYTKRKYVQNKNNLDKNKGKGIMDKIDLNVTPHSQTFRILIIGPSGSGKTTLFSNLIKDFPRPIKSIQYIAPPSSIEDETPQKLDHICKKVKMQYNNIDSTKNELPNSDKPTIRVFDDLYKQKVWDPIIDESFIRGRHDQIHSVYITQSPSFIPSSVRDNYSHLILHKSFLNEDVFKKLRLSQDIIDNIINHLNTEESNKSQFLILKKGDMNIKTYEAPHFNRMNDIIKLFENIKKDKIKQDDKIIELPTPFLRDKLNNHEEKQVKDGIKMSGNNNEDIYNNEIYKMKMNPYLKKYVKI